MTSYFIDEAAIEIPEGRPIVDRTVHVLEVPSTHAADPDGSVDGGADMRLVIERDTIAEGETLAARVDKRLAEHATKLRGFTVLGEERKTLGGLPALVIRARWRHPKGLVHTVEAHVAQRGRHLALLASARVERADACDAWAASIFESIRFRDA